MSVRSTSSHVDLLERFLDQVLRENPIKKDVSGIIERNITESSSKTEKTVVKEEVVTRINSLAVESLLEKLKEKAQSLIKNNPLYLPSKINVGPMDVSCFSWLSQWLQLSVMQEVVKKILRIYKIEVKHMNVDDDKKVTFGVVKTKTGNLLEMPSYTDKEMGQYKAFFERVSSSFVQVFDKAWLLSSSKRERSAEHLLLNFCRMHAYKNRKFEKEFFSSIIKKQLDQLSIEDLRNLLSQSIYISCLEGVRFLLNHVYHSSRINVESVGEIRGILKLFDDKTLKNKKGEILNKDINSLLQRIKEKCDIVENDKKSSSN